VLEAGGKDDETLREIQKILYSTEVGRIVPSPYRSSSSTQDGFEVPENAAVDEEETF
jgi:RP/EB family microtubule-associated protein